MWTLTTLGSCVLRVGGLYQGQRASQWKQITLYVFSFIFDYRYVVLAPSLSLQSLLWNCLSASPFSLLGLQPSFATGGGLSRSSLSLSSSSMLFYFTSVQAAHLLWLAWVQYRVGRCGRKKNLKKQEGGGNDDGGWSFKKATSYKGTGKRSFDVEQVLREVDRFLLSM